MDGRPGGAIAGTESNEPNSDGWERGSCSRPPTFPLLFPPRHASSILGRRVPPKTKEAATLSGTAAPPTDDRPYAEGWAEYRAILRRMWLVTMVGGLAIAALAGLLVWAGAEGAAGVVFPLLAMVWFGSSLFAVGRLVLFSCPRCGQTFFNPLVSPAFQHKCRACGLRKFAKDDQPTRFRTVP